MTGHVGQVIDTVNDYQIIDCEVCGFRHIDPLPTQAEIDALYQEEYYQIQKPDYIKHYEQDRDWWSTVYGERLKFFERHVTHGQRRLLDIGSGPGLFLLTAVSRSWQAQGVEPALQAWQYARDQGLQVQHCCYDEEAAERIGPVDAIHMSAVLEHVRDPQHFLKTIYGQLSDGGLMCVVVPNEYNPFQKLLRQHMDYRPWWLVPPHHINYFDFSSLRRLVEKVGFCVVEQQTTFPIDMFLLMGDNYVENAQLGRQCHHRRVEFEQQLARAGLSELKNKLYASMAELGIGREVVLYCKKG